MKTKTKKIRKITAGIFVVSATFFGLLTLSITSPKLDAANEYKYNLTTNKQENINGKLDYSKVNIENNETHIKGQRSSTYLNVVWASHMDKGKEKDAFYLSGNYKSVNCFKTIGGEAKSGDQTYKKIDLSSVLVNDNEVIEGFALGGANHIDDDRSATIAFWTKTPNDNKYHIYTAGNPKKQQIGRHSDSIDGYKTFKQIKNPTSKNYDFNSIKEISLTYYSLTIWTQESNGNDHLYFGGYNLGQFGDDTINDSKDELKETTTKILKSIKNKKIKDIVFNFGLSGFILTDDNKLFAAGSNIKGELGISPSRYVTRYQEVDTTALNGANIQQMYVQELDKNSSSTLLLVTDKNQLWALGIDSSCKGKGYQLGIHPTFDHFFLKLTQIPLQDIIPKKEIILYAMTYGDPAGHFSNYSILVTKTLDGKHKIYMAGAGKYFESSDPDKKWAYNEVLTKKIFGDNNNSGLDINFEIPNLGNSIFSTPITLNSENITATGIVKHNKAQQYQEKFAIFGNPSALSWETKITKNPTINNSSVRITDSIDRENKKKGSIIYTFDVDMYDNIPNYENSKVIPPKTSIGDEKYELKKGDDQGKGCKVIISNIDLSQTTKDITYNGQGHKFKLQIAYKKTIQGRLKYLPITKDTFDSFTIDKSPKITLEKYQNVQIDKDLFTYYFKIKENTNGHKWISSGEGNTGLTPKIKNGTSLAQANAKLELKRWTNKYETYYTLRVYNLPETKANYNLKNDIYLEGTYKDKDYDYIGSGTWRSDIDSYWNFGEVNFGPKTITPSPTLTTKQIILIVASVFLFVILWIGLIIILLRKKDTKAFAKYEAKKMSLDSDSYALSKVVQERTKKETRQAIKEWKKQMKQDKKFK